MSQNEHAFRLNNINMKLYGLNHSEKILGAAPRDRNHHLRDDEAKPIDMSYHNDRSRHDFKSVDANWISPSLEIPLIELRE